MANRRRKNQRREPLEAAGVGAFLAERLYNRARSVRLGIRRDDLEDLLVDIITGLMLTYRLPRPPERGQPVLKPITAQPPIGQTHKPGPVDRVENEFYHAFYNAQMDLLADVGTDLWRLRQKIRPDTAQTLDNASRAFRHLESIWDTLNEAGFSIQDYTHQAYQSGDRFLRIVAEENDPEVSTPRVLETIRPAIFYQKRLIQPSDVIVVRSPETGEPAGEDTRGQASPPALQG